MTTPAQMEALRHNPKVWAVVYPGRLPSYHATAQKAEGEAFGLIMRTATTDDRLIVERSGDTEHTVTSFALLRKNNPDGNVWAEVEQINSDQMSAPKSRLATVG